MFGSQTMLEAPFQKAGASSLSVGPRLETAPDAAPPAGPAGHCEPAPAEPAGPAPAGACHHARAAPGAALSYLASASRQVPRVLKPWHAATC